MSKFYGTLQGNKGRATRCGTAKSGIVAQAASWAGCVTVSVFQDAEGAERFEVSQRPWHGHGIHEVIAGGVIGQPATRIS